MKRYAVVTFLFDGYDLLREPTQVSEDFDYYCLTNDKDLRSDIWNCIYIPEFDTDALTNWQKVNMAKNGFYKFLPKEYEWWICLDASLRIVGDLSMLISYFVDNNYDLGLSINPKLMSFRDEYYEYMNFGRIDSECVINFRSFTNEIGVDWTEVTGVIEGTMKIYKNTKTVINMLEEMCSLYETACNYKDLNDQCYLTIAFSKFDDKLNTCFFNRQLYHISNIIERYIHNTEYKVLTSCLEPPINSFLLKPRVLKEFWQ